MDQGVVAMLGDDQVGSDKVSLILQMFERLFTICALEGLSKVLLSSLLVCLKESSLGREV